MRNAVLVGLVCLLAAGAMPAGAGETAPRQWSRETLDTAARIPVQDAGRIKPLDTYARFTLLQMNGRRECDTPAGDRITALEWLLDTLFYPEYAKQFQIFLIESPEVMDALGLPHEKPRLRFTYNDLANSRMQLFTAAQQYAAIEDRDRTPMQRQMLSLAHNLHLFELLTQFLNFARNPVALEAGSPLQALFDGAERVGYAEALEKGPELLLAIMQMSTSGVTRDAAIELLRTIETHSNQSSALVLIPPPAAAVEQWHAPGELLETALEGSAPPAEQVAVVRQLAVLEAQKDDPDAFLAALGTLQQQVAQMAAARDEYRKIPQEIHLYRTQPFYYGLVFYLVGFLLVALTWMFPRRKGLAMGALVFLFVPLSFHTYGIVLRCIIRERPPVTTLYETILFISAVAVLIAIIMEFMNRRRVGLSVAPVLGALGLFLANKYELIDGRDTMPNLIAVLDTNFWLSTHVTTVTIGYSAGLLAGAIAHIFLLGKALGLRRGDKTFYRNVTRMTYGVLCFGLLFATLGTVLGGIWANDSWGRFWGWDPKENGALMIVLWGLAVLHARMGGYIRDFGINMAAVFGGIIVAFSWFGTNLLGVGLHSYGFTSGIHTALMTFYSIQSLVILVGAAAWLREKVIVEKPAPSAAKSAPHEGEEQFVK